MPHEPLAAFEGVPVSGQWTLRVADERGSFTGSLDAWWARLDALDPDSDLDGLPNSVDDCIFHANPSQLDTDGDGFGNRCDADLDGNCVVNPVDLGLVRTVFFAQGVNDADFNGDQVVNEIALGILKTPFFQPPGPSGLASCAP